MRQLLRISGRDGSVVWESPPIEPCVPVPRVIDDDRHPPRVLVSLDRRITALDAWTGARQATFGGALAPRDVASIAVADITSDGTPDLIVSVLERGVFGLDGATGKRLWSALPPEAGHKPRELTMRWEEPIGLTEIDGDGVPDAIVMSYRGYFLALSGATGVRLWDAAIDGRPASRITLGPVNDDDVPDVIFSVLTGALMCLDGKTGKQLFTLRDTASMPAALVVDPEAAAEFSEHDARRFTPRRKPGPRARLLHVANDATVRLAPLPR